MATPRKKWPHSAEWTRQDCISLARKGRQALVSELERVNEAGLLRSMARAVESFREIESRLLACKSEEPEE